MSEEEKKKVHPLDRAWAAGVFDARITMPKSGSIIRFESTDEGLVKKFQEVSQVGKVKERDHKKCSHPVYVFESCSHNDSRDLIKLVSPFLTPFRLKQASEVLARIERNPLWRKKNPEKVTSSVTSPAQTADQKTTE